LENIIRVLEELRRKSLELGIPAIDPEDGMILQAIAFVTAATGGNVAVDAGAGIGYSTLWIILGLENGCRGKCTLKAIEYDDNRASILKEKVMEMNLKRVKVEVLVGEALDILERMPPESIDFAFIDIEKDQYPQALELLKTRLKRGRPALFHNAYYPPPPRAFFERVREITWNSTIIPTGPGMLIAIRQ